MRDHDSIALHASTAAVARRCCAAARRCRRPRSRTSRPSSVVARFPGWTFTPGVVFGALYDTNVALAVARREPEDRVRQAVQIEPFGQLEFFSPRTTFSAGYRGTLRRYVDLGELDGIDHRALAVAARAR